MKLQDLEIASKKNRKRVGRGISAGGGKTAGRGTKGQNSRSGGQRNPGFEGGQKSLLQRLPKLPGFRSLRPKLQIIQTINLDKLNNKTISHALLLESGMIRDKKRGVKLLYNGDLKKAYTVELQAASQKAIETLERAGGKFVKTALKAEPKADKAKVKSK